MRWSVANGINRKARNEILHIIRNFDREDQKKLPRDFRSLFTNYLSPTFSTFDDDDEEFVYFGIKKKLNHPGVFRPLLEQINIRETCVFEMVLHVDGLPIFHSSRREFWPILGKIFQTIFIIGVYFGVGKPRDTNNLLKDVVSEIIELEKDGICINGKRYAFRLKFISADAPA